MTLGSPLAKASYEAVAGSNHREKQDSSKMDSEIVVGCVKSFVSMAVGLVGAPLYSIKVWLRPESRANQYRSTPKALGQRHTVQP